MSFTKLSEREKKWLLDIARQSIESRLYKQRYKPELADEFSRLTAKAATFITLKTTSGSLRGCIGTLQAVEALYLSVAHNAVSAAFKDPRFPALTSREWPGIKLSISILTQPEVMAFSSEDNLQQQLRPGIDGLILKEQGRSATFLPSVWDELPDKSDFYNI